MKAVRFAEYGDPQVLEVVDVEAPTAQPGQIRIIVHAAGVNGIDWKIRAGYLRDHQPLDLPAGVGVDAAGIVDQVGDGVKDVAVGDKVFGTGRATYAEKAVLSHWTHKPQDLPFTEAAGLPIPVETASRILDQVGVKSGQTLLVSGASGGVGSAVIQIARHQGVTIIGTASAPNLAYLRSLGAIAITYGEGLVKRVLEVAPDGVDAALDLAGSGVIGELIALTGDASKVLSIADFSATALGAQVSFAPTNPSRAFQSAAQLHTAGLLHLRVAKKYALQEAADAHIASATGHAAGRIVIEVVGDEA